MSDSDLPQEESDYSAMTVAEYRKILMDELRWNPGPNHCAACGQSAKVYYRHPNAGMVRSLIRIYHAGPEGIHGRDLNLGSREWGKLSYWGLAVRLDNGRWVCTPHGRSWLLKLISVGYTAYIYDDSVIGIDNTKRWTVLDAIRKKFDYDELMGNQ